MLIPRFLTRGQRDENAIRRDLELRVAGEIAELSALRDELARKRAACERAIAEAERVEAEARGRIEAHTLGLEERERRFAPPDPRFAR